MLKAFLHIFHLEINVRTKCEIREIKKIKLELHQSTDNLLQLMNMMNIVRCQSKIHFYRKLF